MDVLDGRLAEAQELPNLDAVILDRAASPLIAWIQFGWHAHLSGHMDNDRARQFVHVARKTSLVGEGL